MLPVNIYLKWLFLVGINVALSIFLARNFIRDSIGAASGVFLAIITFIFIYAKLDNYFQKRGKDKWCKSLVLGVSINSLLQFFPIIYYLSGIASIETINYIIGGAVRSQGSLSFIGAYLITLVDGLFLSIIALVFIVLVRFILYLRERNEILTVNKNG